MKRISITWVGLAAILGAGCGAFGGGDDDDDTIDAGSPDDGGGPVGPAPRLIDDVEFALRFGDTGADGAGGVTVDAAGDIYVAGSFSNTVDFGGGPLTSAGETDAYVVKLSPAGEHIWSRRYGGPGADRAAKVIAEGGTVFVVGDFSLTADFDGTELASAGDTDVFAIGLDGAGALQWARRYGGLGADAARGAAGGLGDLFVVGDFSLTADFEGTPLASAGASDGFAARVGAAGGLIWAVRLGGTGADVARGAAVDELGDLFVVGDFSLTADFGGGALASAGGVDGFAVRLAGATGAYGGVQARFGGAGDDGAAAARIGGAGSVFVVGDFSLTADFPSGPLTSAGDRDLFVLRLTSALAGDWAHGLGGAGAEHGIDIALDALGGVFVVGDFSLMVVPAAAPLDSAGGSDVLLARLSADGALQWARAAGGAGADVGAGVASSPADGAVVFVGPFEQSLSFGAAELDSAGASDAFVIKVAGGGALRWSRDQGDGAMAPLLQTAAGGPDGEIAIGGNLSAAADVGGGSLAIVGAQDGFVALYDGDGRHRWSRALNGTQFDSVRAVAVGPAGEVVFIGQFGEELDLGGAVLDGTAAANESFYLAAFSAAGNHLWSRAYSAPGGDAVAYDLAVGADRIAVVGQFRGTIDLGDGPVTGASFNNPFIVVLDGGGAPAWSDVFPTPDGSDAAFVTVAIGPGDEIVTTGSFGSGLDLGGGPLPGMNVPFIGKFDAGGAHQWSRSWSANPSTGAFDSEVAADGAILIAGNLAGTIDFGTGPLTATGFDGFVARLDRDGEGEWAVRLDASANQLLLHLSVDTLGNVTVGGQFDGMMSAGGLSITSAGMFDGVLATLSSTGTVQRLTSVGGTGDDGIAALAHDPEDRALVGGFFSGDLDLGGDPLRGGGLFLFQLRP